MIRRLTLTGYEVYCKTIVIKTVVFVKKQTTRSLKRNKKLRNRSTQIKSTDLRKDAMNGN